MVVEKKTQFGEWQNKDDFERYKLEENPFKKTVSKAKYKAQLVRDVCVNGYQFDSPVKQKKKKNV